MKLTATLVCVLLSLTTCRISFPDSSDFLAKEFGALDEVTEFFEGVFGYFNLPKPSQILECFSDTKAKVYFKSLYEIDQILQDTKERNSLRLHLALGKLALLENSLRGTYACISMTQDFTDLLDSLDIQKRNPKDFQQIIYFYYQAHYVKLLENFKLIIDNLNSQQNRNAGESFGAMLAELVTTVKDEGTSYLAFIGFANGGAIGLDIDEPNDSLECFDDETAGILLDFLYKLSVAVTNGNFRGADQNTFNFMIEQGNDLISKIPDSVFQCYAQSLDLKKLSDKLGVDVTSKIYEDRLKNYITKRKFFYYYYLKALKSAADKGNLHHAGSVYARLIKAIASNK